MSLREFPTEGERFKYDLYERICKYALSGDPNAEELFCQVAPLIPECPDEWLLKLLQVTKKKYMFVFIDEIGFFGEPNYFKFKDLQSSSLNDSPSTVYRIFFQLLVPLLLIPPVLCLVAGRTGPILRQLHDAGESGVTLKFLKLDPFSFETTRVFIQHAMYNNRSFQSILFPGNPQGMDYFSRIVWEYTSGVPIHVRHVLSRLAENRLSNLEWKDLSEEELRKKVETIVPEWRLFVDPLHRRSDIIGVFSSLLFANVFEIPVEVGKTYFECSKLGACYVTMHWMSLVTLKRHLTDLSPNYVELCRIALSDIPIIGFIKDLASAMKQYDRLSSRGMIFETLMSLQLYLRLCFCSRLSEMSIFRKTWVENFVIGDVGSIRMHLYRPRYVASFHSSLAGEFSSSRETFHPSAWKSFFDTWLSQKDGFLISATHYSGGPECILSVSKQPETEISTPSLISLTEDTQAPIYLIDISLKCYDMKQGVINRAEIKKEVDKFLIPISKDIELEEKNVFAIQLIVSTKYTEQVTKQFTEHENWVLDSGIYDEQDNRELNVRSHNSLLPRCSTVNQWLSIPDRCQLVVCSKENLKTFLGSDAYKELQSKLEVDNSLPQTEKLSVLSVVLDSWLSHMPYRVSESEEKSATPEIDSFSDTNTMQVDYGRKRVVRDEPQGSSVSLETNVHPGMDTSNAMQLKGREVAGSSSFESSFDWNTFLRERCGLSEEEFSVCFKKPAPLGILSIRRLHEASLIRMGITDPETIFKILIGKAAEFSD
eukprot:jgi/Galph1/4549/GphlegSOOS_G3204.1